MMTLNQISYLHQEICIAALIPVEINHFQKAPKAKVQTPIRQYVFLAVIGW